MALLTPPNTHSTHTLAHKPCMYIRNEPIVDAQLARATTSTAFVLAGWLSACVCMWLFGLELERRTFDHIWKWMCTTATHSVRSIPHTRTHIHRATAAAKQQCVYTRLVAATAAASSSSSLVCKLCEEDVCARVWLFYTGWYNMLCMFDACSWINTQTRSDSTTSTTIATHVMTMHRDTEFSIIYHSLLCVCGSDISHTCTECVIVRRVAPRFPAPLNDTKPLAPIIMFIHDTDGFIFFIHGYFRQRVPCCVVAGCLQVYRCVCVCVSSSVAYLLRRRLKPETVYLTIQSFLCFVG